MYTRESLVLHIYYIHYGAAGRCCLYMRERFFRFSENKGYADDGYVIIAMVHVRVNAKSGYVAAIINTIAHVDTRTAPVYSAMIPTNRSSADSPCTAT